MAYWLNAFIEVLSGIITQIKESSQQSSHISKQLEALAEKVTQSSQNQASSSEESSASIEEITSSIEEVLNSLSMQTQNAQGNKEDVMHLNEMGNAINTAMKELLALVQDSSQRASVGGETVIAVTHTLWMR